MNSAAAPEIHLRNPGLPNSAVLGGILWIAFVVWTRPPLQHTAWGHSLLALASLCVVPLALSLLTESLASGWERRFLTTAGVLQLPAALLMLPALTCSVGTLAAWLATPWLVTTLVVALAGSMRLARMQRQPATEMLAAIAMMYLSIGGVWTWIDRAGWRPLGFSTDIGLLTAIHFHYAGFALPLLASQAIQAFPSRTATCIGCSVALGVPGLAVGITAAHVGLGNAAETATAWMMALSAIGVAWLHLRLAVRSRTCELARMLWLVSGVVLAAAMLPAALYGARHYISVDWLDIPLMRAVHGTSNALGFTLPALIAWHVTRCGD